MQKNQYKEKYMIQLENIHTENENGWSPLQLAIVKGDKNLVNSLLQHGAINDIETYDNALQLAKLPDETRDFLLKVNEPDRECNFADKEEIVNLLIHSQL